MTAAILHLSSIAPPKLHFSSTDFNAYNSVKTGKIAGDAKISACGRMGVPQAPGLGVEPDFSTLHKVLTFM